MTDGDARTDSALRSILLQMMNSRQEGMVPNGSTAGAWSGGAENAGLELKGKKNAWRDCAVYNTAVYNSPLEVADFRRPSLIVRMEMMGR